MSIPHNDMLEKERQLSQMSMATEYEKAELDTSVDSDYEDFEEIKRSKTEADFDTEADTELVETPVVTRRRSNAVTTAELPEIKTRHRRNAVRISKRTMSAPDLDAPSLPPVEEKKEQKKPAKKKKAKDFNQWAREYNEWSFIQNSMRTKEKIDPYANMDADDIELLNKIEANPLVKAKEKENEETRADREKISTYLLNLKGFSKRINAIDSSGKSENSSIVKFQKALNEMMSALKWTQKDEHFGGRDGMDMPEELFFTELAKNLKDAADNYYDHHSKWNILRHGSRSIAAQISEEMDFILKTFKDRGISDAGLKKKSAADQKAAEYQAELAKMQQAQEAQKPQEPQEPVDETELEEANKILLQEREEEAKKKAEEAAQRQKEYDEINQENFGTKEVPLGYVPLGRGLQKEQTEQQIPRRQLDELGANGELEDYYGFADLLERTVTFSNAPLGDDNFGDDFSDKGYAETDIREKKRVFNYLIDAGMKYERATGPEMMKQFEEAVDKLSLTDLSQDDFLSLRASNFDAYNYLLRREYKRMTGGKQ